MRRKINGKRYEFIINFFKHRNNFYFEIEATDLQNKTHSFINNLNYVLSELDITINDNEKMESSWKVKEKEGKIFFQKTINFMSDKESLRYLENQLNLDQELGEWNKN